MGPHLFQTIRPATVKIASANCCMKGAQHMPPRGSQSKFFGLVLCPRSLEDLGLQDFRHPKAFSVSRERMCHSNWSALLFQMNVRPRHKTYSQHKMHVKLSFYSQCCFRAYSKQLPPINSLKIEVLGTSSEGIIGTKLSIARSL